MRRLYARDIDSGALTPEQARYLSVLRLSPGDFVELFDGSGRRVRAELVAGGFRVVEELPAGAARRTDVVLVQALAKGEKMDLVVQKAVELGASRILPLAAERAVVRLEGERAAGRAERWRKVAQEAARQCGRADVPRVDEPGGWESVFSLLREQDRVAVLLDPEAHELRLGAAVRGAASVLIAVGPEGGFSPEERERAAREGMLAASLGPLVLRTETAGLAALSIVLHVNGELG